MQWGEQGKPSTGLIQLQGSLGQLRVALSYPTSDSGEYKASLLQDHFFTDHTKSETLLEAFWSL